MRHYLYPPENGSPFFSRNIGLANGLPVSLIAGTKLSGDYAGFGVGALSVVTNGTGDTKHSQVLSVARITRPIGESKVGIIFTNGDPTGRSKNTLAGADFQFRDSNFLPGKILQSDFFYQRSFSDTKGDDDSFGVAVNYPNEPWGLDTRFKQVGTNFFPGTGLCESHGHPPVRRHSAASRRATSRAGAGSTSPPPGTSSPTSPTIWSRARTASGPESISAPAIRSMSRAFDNFEDVPATFKVAGKVPVPAGRYHWTNGNLYIQTSNARPFDRQARCPVLQLLQRRLLRVDFRTDIRLGALFQIVPRYTYTYIDLPAGLLNIHAA